MDSSDIYLIRCWRNDYDIWKWCRQNDFISDFEQREWFDKQAKDPAIKMYKIVLSGKNDKEEDTLKIVGVCGFTSINPWCRRAEFSLYIAPAYQKNGFAEQAMKLLLGHGFDNLGFHLIYGEVFEGNPASKLFNDLGFYFDGTRRDFYFRDGKFIDADIISMTEFEWRS